MNPNVKYGIIKVQNYMIFTVNQDKRMFHVLTLLSMVVIMILEGHYHKENRYIILYTVLIVCTTLCLYKESCRILATAVII